MLLSQAEFLIKELRRGIKTYLEEAKLIKIESNGSWLKEKHGAFVTLNTYPEHELRGCIGYVESVYPLQEITLRAAISAAVADPRFPPISAEELQRIILELSILTAPRRIRASSVEELLKSIKLGQDGLIIGQGMRTGLLLPQVATENNMSKEEFLSHTCLKAGLPPGAWMDLKIDVQKFQAEIFSEKSPDGEVVKS